MIISVMVTGSPVSQQSARTALSFCEAALAAGHQLYRVFFYEDGVYIGSSLTVSPQDERNINADWSAFVQKHQLDAVICVASALKRGVLNENEATRYEKSASNLAAGFDISGLGQWVDACLNSDRVVNFGA
ncbi:MAG: sulfurtransferase complex subunit TusD [Pseudohongiella sp.]|nr:sulfurtransferase complex subunit TusD [Pseudohongiella sp.]MDO9519672.1 sulfurtransferase complex subunit TusD [Pseudohongiella sp.]MDP2127633.1 sulfurtransferase complex subunit TusD [Pseudohongiella sp.]